MSAVVSAGSWFLIPYVRRIFVQDPLTAAHYRVMLCRHLVDGAFFQQHRENLFTHRLGENQFSEAPPGLPPVRRTKNLRIAYSQVRR
jgi:hypothetical protein